MDVQELKDEKIREAHQAEEEKARVSLLRQMRVLNQEKEIYTHKAKNCIDKIQITLGFLQNEKPIELENYLATQSASVERKYAREEAVVRRLVKTTAIVKGLLVEEKEANKKLNTQILKVKAEELETRKAAMLKSLERNKLRIPSEQKMDNRVEQANKRYHTQRLKNVALKEKIDTALITRGILCKEEAKLEKELSSFQKKIIFIMEEAGLYYEERDRVEGTRIKLLEHLTKVKESCVKELQSLTSTLTEDKETEAFMRIKQKDNGGFIRSKRIAMKMKIKEMLKKKDEYTIIFDRVKEAIGKEDIEEIVKDFVEMEEDNFATFQSIGELMEENEKLRCTIRELSSDNVDREMKDMMTTQTQEDGIQALKTRIAQLHKRNELCQKSLEDQDDTLQRFYGEVRKLIKILGLDPATMESCPGGQMTTHNIVSVLTDIEGEIADVLRDFTMVELATRATLCHKRDLTEDQAMLLRQPSLHIKPAQQPRFNPMSLNKTHHDMERHIRDTGLMKRQEVEDVVVQDMLHDATLNHRHNTHRVRYRASESLTKHHHKNSHSS